jgi:hypothetical protein
MPVVGLSPSDGHRLELHRDAANRAAPWRYTGSLALAEGVSLSVEAEVTEAGAVLFPEGAVLALEHRERVERTLRMALKHARQDDPAAAPPRRITRWRGDDGR